MLQEPHWGSWEEAMIFCADEVGFSNVVIRPVPDGVDQGLVESSRTYFTNISAPFIEMVKKVVQEDRVHCHKNMP